ncbi:LamG domain-containing protein [Puteibacter caeruleilacunae]|nr:LamG domain-containing protein [Puteibacter caeruleilacunae]
MNSGNNHTGKIMKHRYITALMFLIAGLVMSSCEEVEVEPLVYDDSSFKEVRMYTREIVNDDHASLKDVTVSFDVNKDQKTVKVVVKTGTDLTNLYGIAKLENGCTVSAASGSVDFGKMGDFSQPQKYLVKSKNGIAVEWTVSLEILPPPPPVTNPTGFELKRKDGTNKHIPLASEFGDLQHFQSKYYGHSYDGSAEGFSKVADDPDLNFKNTEDFSLSFWVKTTASNSDPEMLATQNWASSGNTGITIAFLEGNWRAVVSDGQGHKADVRTTDAGKSFNNGSWHLLVVTYDRDGNMTMYQDGEEIGSADMSEVGDIDSGNPFHIAQDGTGGYGDAFTGDIAGTTIYNYVLTADEVSALAD